MRVATNKRVFDPEELRRKYRDLDPQIIADLADLCFASQTVMAPTDRETCLNIGKNAVWLHINTYLTLELDQIERILAGKGVIINPED